MPQIYSGRQQDQLYNAIGNRLVRRSNALEDDYTGDVHPELRRVINEMHSRMPDAFAALKWMSGPDGYEVTGPNRINRVREIVPGSGDATQATASDQPELSRADDRMNLATHSRFPGTLGDWDIGGWSVIMDDGEIVASDDPSDDHQAFELSSEDGLYQQVDFQNGQKFILAARIEAATSTTAEALSLNSISHTVLDSYRDIGAATNGEWLWLDVTLGASGGGNFTISGNNGDRFSRPCLLYRPDNWASLSASEKQTYLTDHYAASGPDHQEFPGFRGMRTMQFDGDSHHLPLPLPPPAASQPSEFWMGVLVNLRADTSGRIYSASVGTRLMIRALASTYRFEVHHGSGSNEASGVGVQEDRNAWVFLVGTAKIGEPLKLYRNGVLIGESPSALPGIDDTFPDRPLSLSATVNAANMSVAWAFYGEGGNPSLAEIANLNSILKGDA